MVRDTSKILTDKTSSLDLRNAVTLKIEDDGISKIQDIHLWEIAQNKYACIICIEVKGKLSHHDYLHRLESFHTIKHLTIEIR